MRADGDTAVIAAGHRPRQHRREAGEDIRKGEVAVPTGTLLRPAHLGLIASVGVGITNLTMVGEVSSIGIYAYGDGSPATMSLHNSIIAYTQGWGVYFTNGGATTNEIRGNCFFGNPAGSVGNGAPLLGTLATRNSKGDSCDPWYNIKVRPLFADSASSNYRLALGSPCVNAGMADTATRSTDLEGNARLIGRAVDMGAFELQSSSRSMLCLWILVLQSWGISETRS